MGTGLGCLVHLSPVPAPPETRMLHARRCRRQTGDQFCSTAGERRPTPPPRIGPARRRRRWLLLPAPDGLPGSPLRDTRPVHHHHDVALQHETSHVATT
ncbi:Os09g0478866 [Oryza sativa Japonica Group]|uniref:Os09g0478866 protein n=1 Tax=Oryza sativa subsp. japonica TaxID=39947 RepID=A0A0P0XN53_ORYSJ|nr:Os09g0478866 [Oryza sativa Japonica Group]